MNVRLTDYIEQNAAEINRRAERVQRLHALWQDEPVDVICEDLLFGYQYLLHRLHMEKVTAQAREAVQKGAGHECSEWLDTKRKCRLCGAYVAGDSGTV